MFVSEPCGLSDFSQFPNMHVYGFNQVGQSTPYDAYGVDVGDHTVDERDGGGDDVTITGDGFTGLFITMHNVDPTKVTRYLYENFKTFINNLVTVLLDCHVMGWVTESTFWQELVPPLYKGVLIQAQISTKLQINAWMELLIKTKQDHHSWNVAKVATTSFTPIGDHTPILMLDQSIRGTLDGRTHPYPSWDYVQWVLMPMNANEAFLQYYVSTWTKVLNDCLQELGHFERTNCPCYSFALYYNNTGFPIPQQQNYAYYGVITYWLIEMFTKEKFPPVFEGDF
ncbi:hypothetical protein Tco_1288522 [Tanacetum coccineum]